MVCIKFVFDHQNDLHLKYKIEHFEMLFTKQIRYFLTALAAHSLVGAFVHEWNHPGFDMVFDIRIFRAMTMLGFAGVVGAVEELAKKLHSNYTQPKFQTFKSREDAPKPQYLDGCIIFIESDNTLYISDGEMWKVLE